LASTEQFEPPIVARDTSTHIYVPIGMAPIGSAAALPTLGVKFTCRDRGGSNSTPPTELWATEILFEWR
jgi:hypothetical protein